MELTNLSLENCVTMNRKHPKTFEIPSKEDIKGIKVNTHVKLIFKDKSLAKKKKISAERMWVKVSKVNLKKGEFIGTLANQPAFITSLQWGDELSFKAEHIASIYEE